MRKFMIGEIKIDMVGQITGVATDHNSDKGCICPLCECPACHLDGPEAKGYCYHPKNREAVHHT